MPPDTWPPARSDAGVVLLAAGKSTRMGDDKMLADLCGRPVIAYSLDAFQRSNRVAAVVVVASPDNRRAIEEIVSSAGYDKVIAVVDGGERRQDSTAAGVGRLTSASIPGVDWVIVHDGARPFVDPDMVERGLAAAVRTGAAVPALPVSDTVKQVGPDGTVSGTLDRTSLRAIQTPQVFRIDLIASALKVREDVTDDAALVELAGGRVAVFDGRPDNIKLTTPGDMELAATIAARNVMGAGTAGDAYRWGTGFDGHGFVDGGPLRLGGIDIVYGHHLAGHSDGDVLLHAVASAILGGAGLGDLGSNFPSDDPAYAGIDSRELLRLAVAAAEEAGWVVRHVDATIVAQRPKLAPYVNRINEAIASALSVEAGSVNTKVTSTDRVGAIGRGEGIAAQAIATLSSLPAR